MRMMSRINRSTALCQRCDRPVGGPTLGRRRQFCSDACRQAAHRLKVRGKLLVDSGDGGALSDEIVRRHGIPLHLPRWADIATHAGEWSIPGTERRVLVYSTDRWNGRRELNLSGTSSWDSHRGQWRIEVCPKLTGDCAVTHYRVAPEALGLNIADTLWGRWGIEGLDMRENVSFHRIRDAIGQALAQL